MATLQLLLTLITRSAGKALNTAFGWATRMLFGQVPQDRQIYLSIIAFGSVAWIVALLGILFPSLATFLLAFVRLPAWVDRAWIRLAMLAAALVIPPVVGVVSIHLVEPADQPHGSTAVAKRVLSGYPATLGLAITLILVTVLVPFMKLPALVRRWSTAHVPVIVEATDYLEVVGELEQVLRTAGWNVARRPASWMLRAPVKVLGALASGMVKSLVAENLTTLVAPSLEVMLHPADLVISGKEHEVARARAAIAEQLAFSKAYLTWTKEANQFEDRLRELWDAMRRAPETFLRGQAAQRLRQIENDLHHAELTYDEWEVLFRGALLVERGLLEVAAGLQDRPKDLTEAAPTERGAATLASGRTPDPLPSGANATPSSARGAAAGGRLAAQHPAAARLAALVALAVLSWLGLKTRAGREILGPANLLRI